MKNKKILILSIIINIIFLSIICIFISGYKNIIREKQVIKEMTTSTLEENLNAQITQLNKSHEDYSNSVNEYKLKIAKAITNQKVETSQTASANEVVTNIGEILKARTSDATATAQDIVNGKTAYVNGELITGITNFTNIENASLKLMTCGDYVSTSSTTFSNNESIIIPKNCTQIYILCAFNENTGYKSQYSVTGYTASGAITDSEIIYQPTAGNMGNCIIRCNVIPESEISFALTTSSNVGGYYLYSIPCAILFL